MNVVHRFRSYFYILIIVFSGCIKEDLEICEPQPVRMGFTFIPSALCAAELVNASDVNRLTVFLFDRNGLFMQQLDTVPNGTNFHMEVLLEPAHYRVVALAGYEEGQLGNTPFVPGVTRIQDAMVATYLEQRNGALLSAEHMLHLGGDTLTVLPETPGQSLDLTMLGRTKKLNFTVDGIAPDRYQIVIAGNAAQYTFEGEQAYLTGNPLIQVPLQAEEDGSYHATSLLNWPLKDFGFFTRLQIIDPETGTRLVDEDMYELLDRVPGFDAECSRDISIGIDYTTDGKIIIAVNGWGVHEDGYILT